MVWWFELFRPDLWRAVPPADRCRGGRFLLFNHVMSKVLILRASQSLLAAGRSTDQRAGFRLCAFGLAGPVPDANRIRTFRLMRATRRGGPAVEVRFGA